MHPHSSKPIPQSERDAREPAGKGYGTFRPSAVENDDLITRDRFVQDAVGLRQLVERVGNLGVTDDHAQYQLLGFKTRLTAEAELRCKSQAI